MSDVVISVEHLSKRYQLGEIGATSLRESAERWLHRLRGRDPKNAMGKVVEGGPRVSVTSSPPLCNSATLLPCTPGDNELWALRDVSFEVKQGEVLGLIGRNGAGKSTLLKVLTRITEPTSGRAILRGRVASLLEVGTGFHPELTGRDNVYLSGAILGMKKDEIASKFDEIVAFSGVEKFIDTPVKRYSSGMYVRLAFAVAAHLDPEILLVDEVLAVGDAAFQKKCIGKMGDVGREGRTVLIVSHNMPVIMNLCRRAILMSKGTVEAIGSTREIVETYMTEPGNNGGYLAWESGCSGQQAPVFLTHLSAMQGSKVGNEFDISKEIHVEFGFRCLVPNLDLYTALVIKDSAGTTVLSTSNTASVSLVPDPGFGKPSERCDYRTTCTIPGNFLNDTVYTISAIVGELPSRTLDRRDDAISFRIYDTGEMRGEYYGDWIGVVRPRLAWCTSKI